MDGGHWYLPPSGKPFYEIEGAHGMRPVTLRDARKVGAGPGATGVLSVIHKPQLERWKREQAILAALTIPREEGESSEQLLARIREDADAQAKQARDLGSEIHDALEKHFTEGASVPTQWGPTALAVSALLEKLFPGVTDWIPEAHCWHPSGYGGRIDLHSPSAEIVVDFKGKDGDFSDGKRLDYDQHYQLGGYAQALDFVNPAGVSLFFSRTHPGAVAHHIWTETKMCEGIDTFNSALELWKQLKHYDPSKFNGTPRP